MDEPDKLHIHAALTYLLTFQVQIKENIFLTNA